MTFLDFLKNQEVKLFDGAMGTQLERYGVEVGGQSSIFHPEYVKDIHKQYIQSGAQILITNTLTMNRIYIETHSINVDVKEVNLAGAKLAKSVASKDHYVLGDMSSTGQMLEPYGTYTEPQFSDNFREQAGYLAEGGVDGFIIETIFDLREALCAVRACKQVLPLPIIATIAFNTTQKGGRTIMGNSAEECAKALTDAGADAVGANCGDLDPLQMAEIVSGFRRATPLPVVAQPNAGKPKLADGKTVFDLSPQEFVEGLSECMKNGATLIGGCCGTGPDHIQALSRMLKQDKD